MEKKEYEIMFMAENTFWWYKALHNLVIGYVEKQYKTKGEKLTIFDAGCGTGRLMQLLEPFGVVEGCDISKEAIPFCSDRGLTNVLLEDLGQIVLPSEKYDVISSIDVLYHLKVKDDKEIVNKLVNSLKRGGLLILNLPAFNILRSKHDLAVHSKKRYIKKDIINLIENLDVSIEKLSYRVGFLFFPILIVRSWQKLFLNEDKNMNYNSDIKKLPKIVNSFLLLLTKFEQFIFFKTKFLNLPIGTSIFAVIRKQ